MLLRSRPVQLQLTLYRHAAQTYMPVLLAQAFQTPTHLLTPRFHQVQQRRR